MSLPPHPAHRRRYPRGRGAVGAAGKWVVVAVLVLGLVGAMIGVVYTRYRDQQAAPPATQRFDPERMQRDLDDIAARVNTAIGRHDTAAVTAETRRFVEKYPAIASGHTLLGQLLVDQGKIKEGLDELELSLKYDSKQAEVEKLAGTFAMSLNLPEKAVHHFLNATELSPNNGQYRVFLAQAYMHEREFDKARNSLLEAIEFDSHLHEAHYALSDIYAREGKTSLAILQAQHAVEKAPDDPHEQKVAYIQWLAKLLLRDNRAAESLQTLQGLKPADQKTLPVLNDMADCWMMLRKPIEAAKMFEDASLDHPTQWRLPASAAKWYIVAGDLAAARRMTDTAGRLDADTAILASLETEMKKAAIKPPATAPATQPDTAPYK